MVRFTRWYGSNPLHLLVLVCSFALTGYAMVRLFAVRPLAIALWLAGAAIAHDLILLPLYSLADLTVLAVLRHRAPGVPRLPWVNHLRVPALLSGLLLLVWFPLIFALSSPYTGATGLSEGLYLGRWLMITGVLFGASAVSFAFAVRRAHRATPSAERRK